MVWALSSAYGFDPNDIWTTWRYDLAVYYYRRIPEHAFRQNYPALGLDYAFQAFVTALGKDAEPMMPYPEWLGKHMRAWLEPWGKKRDASPQGRGPYSRAFVRTVETAYALGMLTQDDLALLNSVKLRASGAWAKRD